MNSSPLQDVSLYELALSSEQPPHPLQVSPATFKSMVSSMIDVLIDQQISATLWLKFPRGDTWLAEVRRYRKANIPHSIYILSNQKEEVTGEPEASDLPEGLVEENGLPRSEPVDGGLESLMADEGAALAPDLPRSAKLAIQLAPESQLRREYFLVVLSDRFNGLVIAHRPRSIKHLQTESTDPQETSSMTKSGQPPEEDLERKQPLLALCSFEPHTLQQVLAGIKQAIKISQSKAELTTNTEDLLQRWEQLFVQPLPILNPVILGNLFTRQVQYQEEIWHNAATYRKQSEASTTLNLQNEELLNAIRLKDEFLKNVGQELRTPLTNMKTALTLLNSPNIKPPQRQRYMDLISRECDRQSSLITSVLDLVQLESVMEQTPLQPLRLTDVVPGVVSTYQPLAQEKGVMLAYTIPEDLPAVSCLASWLRQIVINLLHNGIKFTPSGGRVWVKATQQGDYIQLEFRDTGIGMSAAEIPKIFDRFYRIRQVSGEDYDGAGLGLAIVQQLLLRCGGSISVRSRPEEGSIFNVLLPIYP